MSWSANGAAQSQPGVRSRSGRSPRIWRHAIIGARETHEIPDIVPARLFSIYNLADSKPEVVGRLKKLMAEYDARLQSEKRPPRMAGE